MEKVHHIFLINPAAGKNSPALALQPSIRALAQELGLSYEIYHTRGFDTDVAFIRRRCRENTGFLRFYACGGDGTLHEVICGIAGEKNTAFGVIPCGSGNDFVRNFPGLDFNDLRAQLTGETMEIDLLRVNDRYTVNLFCTGLDARVAANMVRFKRLPLVSGPTAYDLAILYCLFSRLGTRLTFTDETGETWQDELLLLVAANGEYYGGGFRAAPRARMSDGLLDLCAIHKVSRLKIAALIKKFKEGRHVDEPSLRKLVQYRCCRELTIHAPSPIDYCLDGEIYRGQDIRIQVMPAAANMIRPVRG